TVRHDPGRTRGEHDEPRPPDVRGGVSLVEPRLRRCGGIRPLRDHPRRDARPARRATPRRSGGGSMRRRLARLRIHARRTLVAPRGELPATSLAGAPPPPPAPGGQPRPSPPRGGRPGPPLKPTRPFPPRLELARHLVNSAIVAVATTAIALLLNSMAGYAFAKLRFRGRDRIFRWLLAGLVIPGQVAMLPLFLLVRQLGLVNTLAGVVVPGMASIFGIFLVRQYALAIPDSVLDAARVDGAGELRIYRQIALPRCLPILVTLAASTFLRA